MAANSNPPNRTVLAVTFSRSGAGRCYTDRAYKACTDRRSWSFLHDSDVQRQHGKRDRGSARGKADGSPLGTGAATGQKDSPAHPAGPFLLSKACNEKPRRGLGPRRGLSCYHLGKERAYRSDDATAFNSQKRVRHIQHFTFRNESRLL